MLVGGLTTCWPRVSYYKILKLSTFTYIYQKMSHAAHGVNDRSNGVLCRGSDLMYTITKVVSSSIFTMSSRITQSENISIHVIYGVVNLSHILGYWYGAWAQAPHMQSS